MDLILWFLNIAKIIAPTDTIYKQEITNLKEKLFKNGYPKKFVDDVIERSIYLSMPWDKLVVWSNLVNSRKLWAREN